MHLGFWWAIWSYREVDHWTFRGFASVMLTPALMYLAVNTLVSDNPAAIESWRTHFYARHRIFFALYGAAFLSIPLRQFIVLGDAALPYVEGQPGVPLYALPIIFLIPVIGIVATSERIHAVLVVIGAGMFFLNLSRL